MKIAVFSALALLVATPALAQPAVPSVQPFMVGLSVADIDKQTAWYGDMLGFKALGGTEEQQRIVIFQSLMSEYTRDKKKEEAPKGEGNVKEPNRRAG